MNASAARHARVVIIGGGAIGTAVEAVFRTAREEGITPLEAARRRAERRLAQPLY